MSSQRSLQLSPRIFTLRRQHTELSSTHLRHRQTHCSKSAESAESQVTWWRIQKRGILQMHLSLSNEILSNCYKQPPIHIEVNEVYMACWSYCHCRLPEKSSCKIKSCYYFRFSILHRKGTWWLDPLLPCLTRPSPWIKVIRAKVSAKEVFVQPATVYQSSSFPGKRFKNSPTGVLGGVLSGNWIVLLIMKKTHFCSGRSRLGCSSLPLFGACIVHCSLIWSWHLANRLTGFPSMCSS